MAEDKEKENTATEEEGEDLWGKVVELTQTAFRDGNLAEEATWQTVVLIPKGKGEFWGIGLVEVICKFLTLILHRQLTTIKLHDILHGFLDGRGTGTATREAKLLQQLAAMRQWMARGGQEGGGWRKRRGKRRRRRRRREKTCGEK